MSMAVKNAGGYLPTVGERILVGPNRELAYVRFIGSTRFSEGEWIGAECDNAIGKNDGCVQGVRYFDCRDKHGIFVRRNHCFKLQDDLQSPPVMQTLSPHVEGKPQWQRRSVSSNRRQRHSSHATSAPPVSRPQEEVRSRLRGELAEAAEEHDLARLRELLPLAMSSGVSPSEIANAQSILNYNTQKVLLEEIESVCNAVAKLSKTVQAVEARAQALEKQITSGDTKATAPSPSFPKEGLATSLLGPPPQDWLLEVKQEVWGSLERSVEDVIAKAVAEATRELMEAAAEIREVKKWERDSDFTQSQRDSQRDKAPQKGRLDEKSAIVKLQAAERGRQLRSSMRFREDISIDPKWARIFDTIAGGASSINDRSAFAAGLKEVRPSISDRQANAVWDGITKGMSTVSITLQAFARVCEAAADRDIAHLAEFAGLQADIFAKFRE